MCVGKKYTIGHAKKKKKPARKNVSVCGVGRQTEKQRGRLMC